jgi:hypothetical protein
MKISNRRIALLAGVSVGAVGYAAPAFAATTTNPGVCQSQTAANVAETLDITLVGDTGVTSVNNPASATVSGCATGAIVQGGHATAGDVAMSITNGAAGDVHIDAIASATNTAGNATAAASVFNYGVGQLGNGPGAVAINIDNAGALQVGAIANATATGIANATATFGGSNIVDWGYGVYQSAIGTGGAATAVSASLTNEAGASIGVTASANANGATANANAHPDWGIWQIADGGTSDTVNLTNDGTIDINSIAVANATAGAANANASLVGGIVQAAYSGTDLAATLDNSGTIGIDVSAVANGATDAIANAHATYGIAQTVGATTLGVAGSGVASITNDGSISVSANAVANGATMASANAGVGGGASGAGVVQVVNALAGNTGTASITNNGALDIHAIASAVATGTALANASVDGVLQEVNGRNGGAATASLVNGTAGAIDISATANASGGNAVGTMTSVTASGTQTFLTPGANAAAIGIHQVASATGTRTTVVGTGATATTVTVGGTASAAIANSGAINISANASAVAASGAAIARAADGGFSSAAISQEVTGRIANASFTNSGTVNVAAVANASGTGMADASALALGLVQVADGATVSETIGNSGLFSVAASANAAGSSAAATALAQGAVQYGSGSSIAQVASNSGTDSVVANAVANGTAAANAQATAVGALGQFAFGGSAAQTIVNSGTINVVANATAVAAGHVNGTGTTATTTGSALASAAVIGLGQFAAATSAVQSISNSGTINVTANAIASAPNAADARAYALGVFQSAAAGTEAVSFANSGSINVAALASAAGTTGTAEAFATGYSAYESGGSVANLNVANSGTMNVSATAIAPVTASAHAQGIYLENAPTTTVTGVGTTAVTHVNGNPMVATITNSGTLNVTAKASGLGTTQTSVVNGTGTTATTAVTTHPHSSALATGIRLNAGLLGTTTTTTVGTGTTAVQTVHHNNTTITNSGTIDVTAITNGGPAQAYGIRVTGNGTATPAAGQVLTINNSGDIIATYSTDGGTTFHRGEAIDVSAAPVAATVINLMGGNITGNIELQSNADAINVTTDETNFNGIINSACYDSAAIAAGGDNPALSSCGVGTLTIGDGATAGGNLHLMIDPVDGPSYVFVNTLTVNSDGTLTYDLPAATGGTAAPGTYPQIFADTANLGGTLVANIASPNGLYDTSFYDNVIDANTRNGTFSQCEINGVPTGSLLINFGCVYDADNNVDLSLTRKAFESVAGLNGNANAVGTGLDSYYDVNMTGGQANLFADLFQMTDAAKYDAALNQLSGSVYANYLNSFPSLGVHENDLTDHATNCEIPALAGSVLECRASAPIHVWGQLDYQTRKADGDIEAGQTRSKRFTGLLGIDANVGNSAIVGGDIGYLTNHVRDRQFGDSVRGKGWTGGLYAVYDPGSFFLKGVTTYSSLNGHSRRNIDFAGLGNGTTFAASPTGGPDVKMWTGGLHGGARFPMGASSVLTPYLNYDYVHAKLDGFDESNGNGAELTVDSGHSNHSFLTGGVKWATQLGGVVPEVNVGYRYRFGNERSAFHGWFTPDPENDFDIVSAAQKKGTFLAGLSVGGKMGPVDIRIGYEGEFNGNVTSHSGNFKFVLPLGGHAAPPPPPPPAPVGAPPPPAPVERGERGQ